MFPFPFSFISGVVPDVPVDRIANAKAMSFNGTDQYVEANSTSLTGGLDKLSLSLWINPTNISSWRNIISLGNNNLTPNSFIEVYSYSTQSTSFRIEGDIATGGYVYFDYTPFVSNNNWYHLAIVWDSTESTATDRIKVYIDGTLRGNLSGVASSFDINGDIKIGRTWRSANNMFNGKLDEVALFNTALSASKIQQIYDATAVVGGVPQTANLFTGGLSSSLVYWNRMGDS